VIVISYQLSVIGKNQKYIRSKKMTKLKEFTGILEIKLEVTLPAKSKKEALELLENIYPAITLSYGDNIPDLIDWRDNIDYADWELQD
jgi:hypothetical protein